VSGSAPTSIPEKVQILGLIYCIIESEKYQ